jgi:hypothetical protein
MGLKGTQIEPKSDKKKVKIKYKLLKKVRKAEEIVQNRPETAQWVEKKYQN